MIWLVSWPTETWRPPAVSVRPMRFCAMPKHNFTLDCFDREIGEWLVVSGEWSQAMSCHSPLTTHHSLLTTIHHREHPHASHGPGPYSGPRRRVFTIGVGGPVGSGKTALVERLCRTFWPACNLAVITNDIYTREDAEFLARRQVLPLERIVGVETGGCPHSAIREDASINLAALAELEKEFPHLEVAIIESGGDNLAATFSPELADRTIYVLDVAEGDKIPRKGGPGIMRSDLLVINKIDLAPHVGADLDVMRHDSQRMRGGGRSRLIGE